MQDGVARGEFKANLDIGLAVLSLAGIMNFYFIGKPVFQSFFPVSEHTTEDYTRQAVSIFLDGIRRSEDE